MAIRRIGMVQDAALLLAALFGALLFSLASANNAAAVTCDKTGVVPPQELAAGGPDLVVGDSSNPTSAVICRVQPGKNYYYGNVNILAGGQLIFDEADGPGVNSDFWASAIIIENQGALIARNSKATPQRFGANKAVLTIHLWGSNTSVWDDSAQKFTKQNQGALCKTMISVTVGPCGVPTDIWNSNGKKKVNTNAAAPDYFYTYGALYGDAACAPDCTVGQGYFGNKVLAVSFGGTLQLSGYKGATDDPKLQPGTGLQPNDPQFGANAANSGVSWMRLADGNSLGKATGETSTSLKLERDPGDKWAAGDEIVVTTTDYLPGHSEKLEIGSRTGSQITFSTAPKDLCPGTSPSPLCSVASIQWPHNGVRYGGPNDKNFTLKDKLQPRMTQGHNSADPTDGIDPDLVNSGAETRAAVALLSRSIRIVSAGDTLGAPFPAASTKAPCLYAPDPGDCKYSYGAHMVIRQGYRAVQISGVEFKQMGQGGRIGHYPVHFHMARATPDNTYIVDSSVNESMTRWYVIHATLGVTLARNVGFMSIGHGYYLEDAPETDNKFYSNIGILARGAVKNAQNPRNIPGILARNVYEPSAPTLAHSDSHYPTVFWITNGWNDFIGNMAAGATTCGVDYWLMPAQNGNDSANMSWSGYSALQARDTYAGSTPLKSFYKNYATSTMHSFNTTVATSTCKDLGVYAAKDTPASNAPFLQAPKSVAPDLAVAGGGYYPLIANGRHPTYCDSDGKGGFACTPYDNGGVPRVCNTPGYNGIPNDQFDPLGHCGAIVLDHFTSSFHWAEGNFSAIWLRPQWYLLDNSVVTDVQNGGLSFITGGDYTHSSVIEGYWGLSRNSIFVGHTRKDMKTYYFASDIGPFNADSYAASKKNACDQTSVVQSYCLNSEQGVTMPTNGFFGNQRLNNLYDGPTYQEQNAYFDIGTSPCTSKSTWNTDCMYGTGMSKLLLRKFPGSNKDKNCYIPNAAIGWKSPNGFYYPPAFHSANLQFENVALRHFVIEPLFQAPVTGPPDFGQGGTYKSDLTKVGAQYCFVQSTAEFFDGFSANDRQTELNDDDGSLTGLVNSVNGPSPIKQTISVNEDNYFEAPIETAECASAVGANALPDKTTTCPTTEATLPPPTAKASPYDYVTTAIWPRDAAGEPWADQCSTPSCYGIPLYRQFLTGTHGQDAATSTREWLHWYQNGCESPPTQPDHTKPECRWPFTRMSGPALQRQSMTVNNGLYYLDTSVAQTTQRNEGNGFSNVNVFGPKGQYTVFLVYAKTSTKQTYKIYVGKSFKVTKESFTPTRIAIASFPLLFVDDKVGTWATATDGDADGVTTVTIDLSKAADLTPSPAIGLCQPKKFCCPSTNGTSCAPESDIKNATSCIGRLEQTDSRVAANPSLAKEADRVCKNWAVKDLDCPVTRYDGTPSGFSGGCYGFTFKLPPDFVADGTTPDKVLHRPEPAGFPEVAQPSQGAPNWGTKFANTATSPDGKGGTGNCSYPKLPDCPKGK